MMVIRTCAVFLLVVAPSFAQSDVAKQELANREVQSGTIALKQGQFAEAKQHFEAAERIGGQPSAIINAGIAIAELQMGNYEAARLREAGVLKLVTTDHERAEAHNLIATAWWRESETSEAPGEKLRAAEESFRRAIEIDPAFDAAFFSLGKVLEREGRAEEAEGAFRNFINAAAKNPMYAQDQLSAGTAAPDFTFTDQSGHSITASSLRGRVVLLDFWATWCPPCIKALPAMRQLARYSPADQFVLVSVNEDSDNAAWKRFTAREKMDWTQVSDKNADLYHAFGLAARPDLSIPRYVLMDRDGTVRRIFDGTDRLGLIMSQTVRLAAVASDAAGKKH